MKPKFSLKKNQGFEDILKMMNEQYTQNVNHSSEIEKILNNLKLSIKNWKTDTGMYSIIKYDKNGNLIEKTIRQAEPTLKSLGLQLGKITYKPYLGKDMVLEMWVNGKKVKPGTEVMKTTKVDLVLGDGKVAFDETEIDSLMQQQDLENTDE